MNGIEVYLQKLRDLSSTDIINEDDEEEDEDDDEEDENTAIFDIENITQIEPIAPQNNKNEFLALKGVLDLKGVLINIIKTVTLPN